jgi:hypothetical protein
MPTTHSLLQVMQRPPLFSRFVLVALVSPIVYFLSLVRNAPSALLTSGLDYFALFIAGPLLLVYGFITYQFEQQRPLAWLAFLIGGLCTAGVYGTIAGLFVKDKLGSFL